MSDGGYVIRGGVDGRERLRVLARVMRPTTADLLARAGIAPGLSCLDVGCGGGDVSAEIARLVGAGGRVLGIDLDETKIELARAEAARAGTSWLAFRVAAIGDEVAGGHDLVYCRFVLTHLRDPAAAVAWMLERARPGGVLIVEDIDFRGHFCEPPSAAFARFVELYEQVVRRNGADPDIGPRLPGLLLDAGCTGVGMNVVQPCGFAGEVKQMAALTMQNIGDAVLAAGLASREEIDDVVRVLWEQADDGRTVMSLPRIVQTWGTRPAS